MWDYVMKKIGARAPDVENADIHAAGRVLSADRTRATDRQAAATGRDSARKSGPRRARKRTLVCPVCSTPMVLDYIGKVEVDLCPDCGGIFLDRGELQEISGMDPSSYETARESGRYLIYTPHGMSNHVSNQD